MVAERLANLANGSNRFQKVGAVNQAPTTQAEASVLLNVSRAEISKARLIRKVAPSLRAEVNSALEIPSSALRALNRANRRKGGTRFEASDSACSPSDSDFHWIDRSRCYHTRAVSE
jgi:hypothetical protein